MAYGLKVLADLFTGRCHALKKWLFFRFAEGVRPYKSPYARSGVLPHGSCLVFLRLARSCAGVAHGIQLQYAISTAHPSTGPFSPLPEHGRGENGPVEGLVEAHGL